MTFVLFVFIKLIENEDISNRRRGFCWKESLC